MRTSVCSLLRFAPRSSLTLGTSRRRRGKRQRFVDDLGPRLQRRPLESVIVFATRRPAKEETIISALSERETIARRELFPRGFRRSEWRMLLAPSFRSLSLSLERKERRKEKDAYLFLAAETAAWAGIRSTLRQRLNCSANSELGAGNERERLGDCFAGGLSAILRVAKAWMEG
jgi:hypothetical protein